MSKMSPSNAFVRRALKDTGWSGMDALRSDTHSTRPRLEEPTGGLPLVQLDAGLGEGSSHMEDLGDALVLRWRYDPTRIPKDVHRAFSARDPAHQATRIVALAPGARRRDVGENLLNHLADRGVEVAVEGSYLYEMLVNPTR